MRTVTILPVLVLTADSQKAGIGQGIIGSFHILRDGSDRNSRIVQSSGSAAIDNTVVRAVYASNPLTPLPPQVTENDILAEFTFNLR